jgi:hypothetical protein
MAEYIKFRLTAAKAAVTMAFLALVGGLPETAGANQKEPAAKAASFSWGAHYLKLDGLTGVTQKVFQKLELKLNATFLKVDQTLTSDFYHKHKIDSTFLKIKSASADYLKIKSADASFLKIEDANSSFLKLTDANLNFLKITDANNDFLKIRGTAANSSELGGLTPDAFFQGRGNVVSGSATVSSGGGAQSLLSLPGGIIVVTVAESTDGVLIGLNNGTSSGLPAVQYPSPLPASVGTPQPGSVPTAQTLQPGNNSLPLLSGNSNPHELTVQILPNASFRNVVTIVLTTFPGNGTTEVAAQAFTGGV